MDIVGNGKMTSKTENSIRRNEAWRLEQEGRLLELVGVTMGNSFPEDEVTKKCIRIGLCCQESIQDRPTVSYALLMLSNNSVIVPPVGRPGYQCNINCQEIIN
ncbi:hypothetical protein HYC85_002677 [Camellia sinensis]|uniref:S-locus receptor kinase C-terminal domain-containing protein n=1 Tax=Camellia sinensis TaxID=4442 RepID=A0A7J7IB66_CAMSI|nr:hypothetical protein HYC85_002677 [Camellia sinensis]